MFLVTHNNFLLHLGTCGVSVRSFYIIIYSILSLTLCVPLKNYTALILLVFALKNLFAVLASFVVRKENEMKSKDGIYLYMFSLHLHSCPHRILYIRHGKCINRLRGV